MADPVWVLVMFDLPVVTKDQRREAGRYRNMLYDLGFAQIQLSVYTKYVVNASGVRTLLAPIKYGVPAGGAVRMLRLTDEQWAATYRFWGPQEVAVEDRPRQLVLFGTDGDGNFA
jgi:CRISPR-associated protein Cas2